MELNIKQRFFVVGIYVALILGIGYYFSNGWQFLFDTNDKRNAVFIAAALALVLSSYITEPYFSKPIDVVTRWIAVFLFLIGLNNKESLLLYNYWIYASIGFTASALLLIFLHGFLKFEKFQKAAIDVICKISRPEIIFSILYFDIVISFFQNYPNEFPILIGFGFLLIINKPIQGATKWLWSLFAYLNSKSDSGQFIGQVIGHESIDFYKVEITGDLSRHSSLKGRLVFLESEKNGIIGIVVNEKYLLSKKWMQVFSLRDRGNLIAFNIKSLQPLADQKTIFSKTNAVSLLNAEELSDEITEKLKNNAIYKNFANLIGYVWSGSTINQIKFQTLFDEDMLKEKGIGEGTIIQAEIANQEVLYQIIDAKTSEENLEYKDSHGFIIGTAQKLGKYDFASNELNTVKWLPDIYSPIFLLNPLEVTYTANNFIGKLPKTNYGIAIKSPNDLVTHNTAILGILGIGKSCLTFELLQKLINTTETKIFCIDLTNQYAKELPSYIGSDLIQEEITEASRNTLKTSNPDGTEKNPESWGNERLYKTTLDAEINEFIQSDKRLLTLNPDWHSVSKAGSNFNIQHKVDLTAAEKTRIISERIFMKAKNDGETLAARYLIVFEEAHSLVPEWNSVASDGDKNATNGTAKVILQGRKYGLGSMVITQRTANISKSILNQCNTIFALRVFDDTGKQFLENYIGSEYSNLLSTLEERHAVLIGKALKLKQPVIIELNNREQIQL